MLTATLGLSMPGASEWLMIIVGLLLFFYWATTLVDVINRNFPETSTKVIWLLIVIFLGVIGAAVYNFWSKKSVVSDR
ncbi:MAG: PLDc N-terminal domain-containing protein [Agriterribacter sp.]